MRDDMAPHVSIVAPLRDVPDWVKTKNFVEHVADWELTEELRRLVVGIRFEDSLGEHVITVRGTLRDAEAVRAGMDQAMRRTREFFAPASVRWRRSPTLSVRVRIARGRGVPG